jgi:hypothetical protein
MGVFPNSIKEPLSILYSEASIVYATFNLFKILDLRAISRS